MGNSQSGQVANRPLLVRGETLRLDVIPPSSGGGKEWPVPLPDAAARVVSQAASAANVLTSIDGRYIGGRPILEIVLHDYALAASWYPKKLFKQCGFVHVGSAVRNNERTVYVATPDNGLQMLQQIALNWSTASGAIQDGIQAVNTISVARGVQRDQAPTGSHDPVPTDTDEQALVEIVLHGQPDEAGAPAPAGEAAVESVRALITASGGTTEDAWIRNNDTATFIPARVGSEGLSEILKHNSVRLCQPMPQLRQLPSPIPIDRLPLEFERSGPNPRTGIPPLKVAVFDGGVDADSDIWQGRVVGCEIGTPRPTAASRAHGALVTSAMLYGHLTGQVLPPPANLDITHYAAVPQAGREYDLQMYWLLDTIAAVVQDNEFDVVLVCVGPDLIVTDDHIDRWTSTIDQLSFEHDVLFVVAAGNNGDLDAATGMNRVLVPADAVNGITVGAAGSPTGTAGASYSAKGPGRTAAQILPTGIAFGGSESEPFVAVDNDGTPLQFKGTSCAAPLVVHGLARAAERLGLRYRTSTVLRCCAVHFAETSRGQKYDHVGYGHLPSDYPEINYNESHVVHVLYEGQTVRGEVDVLALPMPAGMPAPVDIRITLVSTSEVNATDAGDYVGAGLEIAFRPDNTVYKFTSPTGQTKELSLTRDAEEVARLKAEGWKQKPTPTTRSWNVRSKTEACRRASGKWESVQVIDHRLQSAAPVQPQIELAHYSRERATMTSGTAPLKWSMLVTLECPRGTDLYQAVLAEFPTLRPHVITIEPDAGPDIEAGE